MALGEIGRRRARIDTALPDDGKPEELARLEVALEEMQYHLNLAQTISERRARECERLEREFVVLRAERDGYRHQLEERNRMLGAIFNSRSWRWTRALRRTFGRG